MAAAWPSEITSVASEEERGLPWQVIIRSLRLEYPLPSPPPYSGGNVSIKVSASKWEELSSDPPHTHTSWAVVCVFGVEDTGFSWD